MPFVFSEESLARPAQSELRKFDGEVCVCIEFRLLELRDVFYEALRGGLFGVFGVSLKTSELTHLPFGV